MATNSARLGLTLPEGGDNMSAEIMTENFRKLDTQAGATPVTSTSRPSNPYAGQIIMETDTGNIRARTPGGRWSVVQTFSGWTNITTSGANSFFSGFSNYPGTTTFEDVGWAVENDEYLILRGLVYVSIAKPNGSSHNIFTISDSEARPRRTVIFSTMFGGTPVRIDITPAGVVQINLGGAGSPSLGAGGFFSLSGLRTRIRND